MNLLKAISENLKGPSALLVTVGELRQSRWGEQSCQGPSLDPLGREASGARLFLFANLAVFPEVILVNISLLLLA